MISEGSCDIEELELWCWKCSFAITWIICICKYIQIENSYFKLMIFQSITVYCILKQINAASVSFFFQKHWNVLLTPSLSKAVYVCEYELLVLQTPNILHKSTHCIWHTHVYVHACSHTGQHVCFQLRPRWLRAVLGGVNHVTWLWEVYRRVALFDPSFCFTVHCVLIFIYIFKCKTWNKIHDVKFLYECKIVGIRHSFDWWPRQ